MKFRAFGVLEAGPDGSLFRTSLLSRRSCLTFAAAPATSGAGHGRSRKYGGNAQNDSFRVDHFRRTMGPAVSDGDEGLPRPASKGATPRSPNSDQRPDFDTGRFQSWSHADRADLSRPPVSYAPSATRRSEQERAARKAARVEDKATATARNSQGCCYGCGAMLQTDVPMGAGYVAPDKYAVRKQRRQLDKVLCQRCSELCNGAMIPAVQDFTQKLQLRQLMANTGASAGVEAAGAQLEKASVSAATEAAGRQSAADEAAASLLGKVLVSPEQLRCQLKTLALRAAVVVLLVDLTDASGSLLARVRDMVGRNPIVMVGTKLDLLPEGCRPGNVAEWLSGAAASKKLNVVSVHLVSSHTGEGMSAAVSAICSERKSRDVYVVGAANVGKSAFVRAMLKEMSRTDPAAIGTGKYLPVESAMPGTTLGLIPLRAFSGGGILYDTPGVHLHHRIPHMLSPAELKLLHPRRRLSASVPPLPTKLVEGDANANGAAATTNPRLGDAGAGSWSGDVGASSGSEGVVRRGRGGLKIVDYVPTDEYGMPITGLDVGIRRAGSRKEAGSHSTGRNGDGLNIKQSQVARATYMWSDLVRIDVLLGPPSTALVFYGPSTMRAVGLPYIPPDRKLEVEYGADSNSNSNNLLVCTDSVAMRGGLQPKEMVVRANGAAGTGALADVAVSGLPGWVSVWAPKAKQDVRLRVWVPRGVEVMLRPSLPCPVPRALERAWKGDEGRGDGKDDEDEEPAALDEWSRALADGVGDPTADPAWWEAMAALKDEDLPGYDIAVAAGTGRRSGSSSRSRLGRNQTSGQRADMGTTDDEDVGEDDEDDLPDWDDEAELLNDEGDGGDGDREEERVLVTARVEDILKRPRLDVLGQMDLDLANDEAHDEDDDVSSFTLTKTPDGRRRRDGPAADGMWDPLAAAATVVPSATQTQRSGGAVAKGGSVVAGSLRRRLPADASRSSDAAAAEEEQEEGSEATWNDAGLDSEEQELQEPRSTRRRVAPRGSSRPRLGRRRQVVQVAVSESEGDADQGEVS